jgi:hypothetical protein
MDRLKQVAWRIAPIALICAALAVFGGGVGGARFGVVGAAKAQTIGEGIWKSVPHPSSPTWDPSNKGSAITLSGGNLIATQTSNGGTNFSVRSTTSHSTGKYYFEISVLEQSGGCSIPIGFGTASANVTSSGYQLGIGDNFSVGFAGDGAVYYQMNGSYAAVDSFNPTATGVAIDAGAQSIWIYNGTRWNGSGTANPATNTGGIALSPTLSGALFTMMSGCIVNDETTLNFTGPYTYSVPSGFGNW